MKYNYIGLQFGGECRADTNIGKYEKLPDTECNMPCARNIWQKCGASFRQLIFDLRQIGPSKKDCGTNVPVDCTKKAGYDPKDVCLQTCVSPTEVDEKQGCVMQCKAEHDQVKIKYPTINEDALTNYL